LKDQSLNGAPEHSGILLQLPGKVLQDFARDRMADLDKQIGTIREQLDGGTVQIVNPQMAQAAQMDPRAVNQILEMNKEVLEKERIYYTWIAEYTNAHATYNVPVERLGAIGLGPVKKQPLMAR
jgi:hypothetical protein